MTAVGPGRLVVEKDMAVTHLKGTFE